MRKIRNCNVCVVGGAGFLGSHLVNHLIDDRDCYVVVMDNLISGHRKYIHKNAKFRHVDITGSEHYLLRLFKLDEIEYIFNYAAEPYVPLSFERPLHVFDVNAFGALKVINAAEEAGCKAILQVSSAEMYGDEINSRGEPVEDHVYQNRKINEDHPVTPHSSYGASKAAIDAIVQVRWRESGTPVISLRQFNCVGERETHPYVVPEIISQVHGKTTEEGVIHLGNNSSRDFQYAKDAVRMAVALLEHGQFGEVYNMGSEQSVKIYDLASMIGGIMGWAPEHINVVQDPERIRPWEIWHLQSCNDKLYSIINERPQVSLEEALKRTIAYFHKNGDRWDW